MPLFVFAPSAYLEWSTVLNREDFTKNQAEEPTKDSETSFVRGSRSRGDTDSESRLRAWDLVYSRHPRMMNLPDLRNALLHFSIVDARGEKEEVCRQVRWHTIDSSTNFCICRWLDLQESRFSEVCRGLSSLFHAS